MMKLNKETTNSPTSSFFSLSSFFSFLFLCFH
jgi:hypothetical protein